MTSRTLKRTIVVAMSLVALLLAGAIGNAQTIEQLHNPPAGEWPVANRNPEGWRYSPLSQIDRANVAQLRLAWSLDLGFDGSFQGSPVVWDGVMYIHAPEGVVAVDAANGQPLWEYWGELHEATIPANRRGGPVVYDGKVYITQSDGTVVALDAKTGDELWATVVGNAALSEGFTTGPIFADGKIVVGPMGADFGGAPGRIIALDAQSGDIVWTFNTVPLSPEDPGWDTWSPMKPSWEDGVGGGSAWNMGTYDTVTGTVVWGVGQPTPWDRLDHRRQDPEGEISQDLFTASFVGIDVKTGELKWYHQVVPSDEWDFDQHTVPVVADVQIKGETRRTAILPTTTGFVVAVDAETGEFFHAHQFHPEVTVHLGYTEDGQSIINPDARYTQVGDIIRQCPGIRWAHIAPGAYSPDTGLYYRPNQNMCQDMGAMTLPANWQPGQRAWWADMRPQTEEHTFDRWGALTAINPATGEVAWEFGYDYPNNAGPMATAGELVFALFQDRVFRAFDAASGDILWSQILPGSTQASPMSYEVDGKQYVAALVGSGMVYPKPGSDLPPVPGGRPAVLVFSLP